MSRATRWRHWRIDAAGAGACLALSALCYFAGIEPLWRRQAEQAAGRERLASAQSDADAARAARADVEDRLEALRARVAGSPLRLERLDRMNARVADLNALAGDSGLEIDEIKPGSPDPGPYFTRVPIRIAGNGPYRSCMLFLHRLSREFPDMGAAGLQLRGDPSTDDTPALFTFDLVWFAAPSSTADATK